MARYYGKEIVQFETDLNKIESREEVLSLSIIPPKDLVPTPDKSLTVHKQGGGHPTSYSGRLTHPYGAIASRPYNAPSTAEAPMMHKPCVDKHLFGQLDPEWITIGKDLNLLPPRKNETLSLPKYCHVKPRVTIDGVRAKPSQAKPFSPPKPKLLSKVIQPAEEPQEKHKRITVGVVHKRLNELQKYT